MQDNTRVERKVFFQEGLAGVRLEFVNGEIDRVYLTWAESSGRVGGGWVGESLRNFQGRIKMLVRGQSTPTLMKLKELGIAIAEAVIWLEDEGHLEDRSMQELTASGEKREPGPIERATRNFFSS